MKTLQYKYISAAKKESSTDCGRSAKGAYRWKKTKIRYYTIVI